MPPLRENEELIVVLLQELIEENTINYKFFSGPTGAPAKRKTMNFPPLMVRSASYIRKIRLLVFLWPAAAPPIREI